MFKRKYQLGNSHRRLMEGKSEEERQKNQPKFLLLFVDHLNRKHFSAKKLPCTASCLARLLNTSLSLEWVSTSQNWCPMLSCSGHACSRCSVVMLPNWQGFWPRSPKLGKEVVLRMVLACTQPEDSHLLWSWQQVVAAGSVVVWILLQTLSVQLRCLGDSLGFFEHCWPALLLFGCTFLSCSVCSLIAKYVAMGRYPLQGDCVGSAWGDHVRWQVVQFFILCCLESVQNGQGISREDNTAGGISDVFSLDSSCLHGLCFCLKVGWIQTDSEGFFFPSAPDLLYVGSHNFWKHPYQ